VPAGSFPLTRWTLVKELRGGGAEGERALSELCGMYWYPIYAFLRVSGAAPADAEDLTQEFFLRLLQNDLLATADAKVGKLRTYLLAALKRFRISEYRKETALKRGGGAKVVRLDAVEAERRFSIEPKEMNDPEIMFERRWAHSLLDEALSRLEREYGETGKAPLFESVSPFLSGGGPEDGNYAEIGARHGMSAGAVQVAVHRLRKRFRRHFESAVAETLEHSETLEEELRHVLRVISG
jgi:RNA polymerase sigma-70 factor (ECF subfamily)